MPGLVAGPLDRLRTAVVDVLTADADVLAWTGGRIYGVIDPPVVVDGLVPDVAWPAVLVGTDTQSLDFRLSNEVVTPVTIGIWALWEEQRLTLDPDEPGTEAVVRMITAPLFAAGKAMTVARYGKPLATNFLANGSISHARIPREQLTSAQLEAGVEPALLTGRLLEIPVTWELTLSRPTLEIAGW